MALLPQQLKENKARACNLARQFLSKRISFEDLAELYPKPTSDQTLEVLYNLIQNQPKVAGIYGVGIIKFDAYNAGILKVVELIEQSMIDDKDQSMTC